MGCDEHMYVEVLTSPAKAWVYVSLESCVCECAP